MMLYGRLDSGLLIKRLRFGVGRGHTPSCQFRLLAQPRLHGLFVGEVLVFLLFKEK